MDPRNRTLAVRLMLESMDPSVDVLPRLDPSPTAPSPQRLARFSGGSFTSLTSSETCMAIFTRTVRMGGALSMTLAFFALSGQSLQTRTTGSTARNRAAAP